MVTSVGCLCSWFGGSYLSIEVTVITVTSIVRVYHILFIQSPSNWRFLTICTFCFFKKVHLFSFWLHWVFVALCQLSLVVVSGGCSSFGAQASYCSGFSSCGAQALGAQASVVTVCWLQKLQHIGSVLLVHRLWCSAACGIFPEQGLNPRPLHWILIYCATREVSVYSFLLLWIMLL